MFETLKEVGYNCLMDLWKAPLWAKGLLIACWFVFCLYGTRGAGLAIHWIDRTYDKLTWKRLEYVEADTSANKQHFEFLRNPIHFYKDK